MTLIGAKRLQQGVFEALASSNRAAGSGGGAGLSGMQLAGSSSYSINQSTSSTSAVDVPGSAITVVLPRPGTIIAFSMVSAHMNAAPTGSSSVIINSNGVISTRMRFPGSTNQVSITEMGYAVVSALQAGSYTWKLQFYADFNTDTITLIDWKLDAFYTLS